MTTHMPLQCTTRAVVVCALGLAALVPMRAQVRGDGPVVITVAEGERLNDRLFRLVREGYRLDVVAVPDAPFVPDHVVALLSEMPEGIDIDYEVVDDTRLVTVGEKVSALAEKGYVLRGFTVARARFNLGRGFVAVMEREAGRVAPAREYRFVHTRGTSQDWRVLERAAADGFTVTKAIVWPDAVLTATSDIVFVCERERGGGTPTRLTLVWDARADKLEEQVNKRAAAGETLVSFWASRMYLNALMTRPVSGPAGPARKYVIDSDPLGTPAMTSLSGRLVNWVRYRSDEQVGAYALGEQAAYDIVTDEIPDTDWNLTGSLRRDRQLITREDRSFACAERRLRSVLDNWLPCEAWRLRDRLADRYRRGERAIDARYRRDARGRAALDVIVQAGLAR